MRIFYISVQLLLLCVFLPYTGAIMADNTIAETIELLPEQIERYKKKNINILGAFKLRRQTTSGKLLSEFSGLAWDKDEEQLYALSDRGYIVTLKPQFMGNRSSSITLLNYTFLKDKNGKRLKGKMSDSEGLALANSKNKKKGDTEFLVSFERKPRIIRYNKLGEIILRENINSELDEINNYKGSNKALESLGVHDKFGLITGPEKPFNNSEPGSITLFSSNQHRWRFTLENGNDGALVGLTTLPDNRMIALERIFSNIFSGVKTIIHLIELTNETIIQKKLSRIEPADGYLHDNFEGITWHKENRFFMISDDNNSVLQKSLLVYFEITSLKLKN